MINEVPANSEPEAHRHVLCQRRGPSRHATLDMTSNTVLFVSVKLTVYDSRKILRRRP
jgi:hypothetical protein